MNNNENLFVIVECPICRDREILQGDKEISDRKKFGFWCDECLASMFNEVNDITRPLFEAIN